MNSLIHVNELRIFHILTKRFKRKCELGRYVVINVYDKVKEVGRGEKGLPSGLNVQFPIDACGRHLAGFGK